MVVKFNFKNTFTITNFLKDYFESFLPRLTSKFANSGTGNMFFLSKINMGL
jgi:hypothetical protein